MAKSNDLKYTEIPLTDLESPPEEKKYEEISPDLTQVAEEKEPGVFDTISDAATGLAQGLTFGLSDEAVAAAKAAYGKATGEKNDLVELYEKYKKIEQQKIKEAEERSPWATGMGEVVGGAIPAVASYLLTPATGGAAAPAAVATTARTAGLLSRLGTAAKTGAKIGAVTGLGKSEASLLEEDGAGKVAKDVLGGAIGGAVLAPVAEEGLRAAGKGVKYLAEGDLGKRLALITERAEKGLPGFGERTKEAIATEVSDSVNNLAKSVNSTLDKLGENITAIERKAISDNIKITPGDEAKVKLGEVISQLVDEEGKLISSEKVSGSDVSKLRRLFQKITGKETQPTMIYDPVTGVYVQKPGVPESFSFKDADELRDILKRSRQIPAARDSSSELKKALELAMEAAAPGLSDAKSAYNNFAKNGIEILGGKGLSSDMLETFLSDKAKRQETIRKTINDTAQRLTRRGTTSTEVSAGFNEMKRGFEELAKTQDPKLQNVYKLIEEAGWSFPAFENELRKTSLTASTLRDVIKQEPATDKTIPSSLWETISGLPRKSSYFTTDKTARGYYALKNTLTPFKEKAANVTRAAFSAAPEELQELANQAGKHYSEAMKKAIEEKDALRMNSIVFAMMQKPELREQATRLLPIAGYKKEEEK